VLSRVEQQPVALPSTGGAQGTTDNPIVMLIIFAGATGLLGGGIFLAGGALMKRSHRRR
jgi:hypothetical protein